VVVGLEQERRHGSEEQRPADALGAVGAEVARHLPTAHREGRLIALTEAVDVIVVRSRGYGPLKAVQLGSVSGQLVRSLRAP
jgi:nucleotide-binding universal stress UspA family protein